MRSAIRDIAADECARAGTLLCEAFREDPFTRYTFGEGKGYDRVMPGLFASMARWCRLCGHAWCTADLEGVALLRSPGHYRRGVWGMLRAGMLSSALKLGWREWSRLASLRIVDGRHKAIMGRRPHWYLETLGVAPEHQGRGLGSALLTHVFLHSEADGVPCYLETSTERNVRMYEAKGFVLRDSAEVSDSLTLYIMVREAGAG